MELPNLPSLKYDAAMAESQPPDLLLNQHPIALRLGAITEHVLDFYELVASPKSEQEMLIVETMLKKYPKVCAAKLRIAPTLLNKVLPNRSLRLNAPAPKENDKPRITNLTAKELHGMGLTTEQLRKLAGMGDIEEAEIGDTDHHKPD